MGRISPQNRMFVLLTKIHSGMSGVDACSCDDLYASRLVLGATERVQLSPGCTALRWLAHSGKNRLRILRLALAAISGDNQSRFPPWRRYIVMGKDAAFRPRREAAT